MAELKEPMVSQKKKRENPFISIIFNIVLPFVVLSKFSKAEYLGPTYGLLLALAFPTIYFLYDWFKNSSTSFVAILGFVSVFLTGVIGMLELPSEWIAYKEASVPFLIGCAILISMKTKCPLVRKMLYNDSIMDVARVDAILEVNDCRSEFDRILANSSYLLAASFALSTITNFGLAKYLIHSPSGTEAFAQELARMTALSFPVNALPATIVMMFALWYLIKNLTRLTGLKMEEMLAPELRDAMSEEDKKK
ncbi:MAG: hypothetical protein MJZ14_07785 [Paludibacteraceae bacterium]|nr:hypothetical protein [Paludibacteraceae bacterium]